MNFHKTFQFQNLSRVKRETSSDAPTDGDSPWILDLTWDDATWILTASFIIFTMQTGFGMLESGCVSVKNEANIMMKNVVDVVFGGLTYWLFGFSLSFGQDFGSTPFLGFGEYLVDSDNIQIMGPVFAAFMFQLSFATTATTIVSGTMAERCSFKSYCVFSMLNTIVYCVPARWIWSPGGFLNSLGVIDIAGSGAVHLLGGVSVYGEVYMEVFRLYMDGLGNSLSGFVAAWMLGPRYGRYDKGIAPLPLGNPTSCLIGLYILWWGWLAFNSGSTFGVSGFKWKFAARATVTTMIASIGGGIVGAGWSFFIKGPSANGKKYFEVMDIVNPVLGALVAITAGCALYRTIDAMIIGAIGGILIILTASFCDQCRVDDPVGATPVHAFGGLWGLVAVALFAEEDQGELGVTKGNFGLFRGGDTYLLKIQLFAGLCISVWAAIVTFILLWTINKIVPIRMPAHEEILGADFVEHLVRRREAGVTRVLSAISFTSKPDIREIILEASTTGTTNPRHDFILNAIRKDRLHQDLVVEFQNKSQNQSQRESYGVQTGEDTRKKIKQINTENKGSSVLFRKNSANLKIDPKAQQQNNIKKAKKSNKNNKIQDLQNNNNSNEVGEKDISWKTKFNNFGEYDQNFDFDSSRYTWLK